MSTRRRELGLDSLLSMIECSFPALRDGHREALAAGNDQDARRIERVVAGLWDALNEQAPDSLAVERRALIVSIDRAAREGGDVDAVLTESALLAPRLALRIAALATKRQALVRRGLEAALAGWLRSRSGATERVVELCRTLALGADAVRKELGPIRAELARRAADLEETQISIAAARARTRSRPPPSMDE